jgi:hypothetical protein
MAEQENGSSPLAEALARVGDRWTLLVVEALPGVIEGWRLPFKHAVSLVTVRCLVGEWEHLTRPDRLGIVVSPDRSSVQLLARATRTGCHRGPVEDDGLRSLVLRGDGLVTVK